MKLILINGNLWELTTLQQEPYGTLYDTGLSREELNNRCIKGLDLSYSGICRQLSNNQVRSTATAIIEIIVNGLPSQEYYTIFHNSKGFFCKVQGQRVFLKDIL